MAPGEDVPPSAAVGSGPVNPRTSQPLGASPDQPGLAIPGPLPVRALDPARPGGPAFPPVPAPGDTASATPRMAAEEVQAMRTARLIAGATAAVLVGAGLGFLAALLKPRRYADFSGARRP